MPRRTLTESDVVFMSWTDDPEVYRRYGATVVAWGGAHTRARVALAGEMGVHATGTMWCLTVGPENLHKDPDLREAVVRDIAGEPIIVPWQSDKEFEGTPSWWACSNQPAVRAHQRKMVCAAMAGNANGLHVDDYMAVSAPTIYAGGCFCDACMTKFTAHLQVTATPALLQAAGVASFDNFDYRTLVRLYAATREKYLERQNAIPLHREFVTFQIGTAVESIQQFHRLAEEIVERPISLSANTGLPWIPHLPVVRHLTYLVGEVEQHAADGLAQSSEAVVAYRMASALGRPIAATGAGWDWAFVKERGAANLVCYWIAQSYACGQRLMAPHRQWCYTPEQGQHHYQGPAEVYAPLYRFVRANARLFDGYQAAGVETAVILSPFSAFFGAGPTRSAEETPMNGVLPVYYGAAYTMTLLEKLAAVNLPFAIEIPRDVDGIGDYLRKGRLAGYRRIFVVDHPDEPLEISERDRQLLAEIDMAKHTVTAWPPQQAVDECIARIDRPWTVSSPSVWVFPRMQRNHPPVIHLLNRDYDPATDIFTPQRDVTLTLSRRLYPGSYTRATLYCCDGEPSPLALTRTPDGHTVTLPALNLWGVVVLE